MYINFVSGEKFYLKKTINECIKIKLFFNQLSALFLLCVTGKAKIKDCFTVKKSLK